MINYNVDPYYDDFDPSKNYHRILFQPGRAVQARELTQSQTILQNQISEFASAIYSQNTPVSGGQVTTNLKCNYIKLNTIYGGSSIVAANFLNKTITDSTGTINARVIATAEATGNATVAGDPPTLVVTYLSGTQFSDGMTVYIQTASTISPAATTIGSTGGTTSVGNSSVASISAGVFYVVNGYNEIINADGTSTNYSIGNFVNVLPQTVILDKYDNNPSLRIGLNITENTVTSSQDLTLLDPAAGASNYQAPGADRYQIILTLETRPLTLGNDDGFIELLKTQTGQTQTQTNSTVYSAIDDYFAKRTYDTNGDFIVNSFNITPSTNTANSQLYDVNVGPGIAYVRGYRIENQASIKLTNSRSRNTVSQNNNPVFVDYGNFIYIDTVKGLFDVTTLPAIDYHCVPYANVSTANTTAYNATKVGSGYIRNLIYDHNVTDANTLSYVYRAYVTDFTANTISGNTSTATSTTLTINDVSNAFSNVTGAYVGTTLSIDSGTSGGDLRTITGYNGSTKVITVNKAFSIVPDTTTKFSLKFNIGNANSLINQSSLTINAKANVNASGKTYSQTGGVTIGTTNVQAGGTPELIYRIGYPFLAGINNSQYSSTEVFRSKSFSNVSGASQIQITLPVGIQNIVDFAGGTGTLSTSAIEQNYTVICTSNAGSPTINVGDVIPFVTAGRSVSISTDKNTLTLNTTDTANVTTGMTVSIIAKVNITNGDDTNHVVRAKNLVTGNTSVVSTSGPDGVVASYSYVDLTNGQVYIQNAGLVSPGSAQILYVTDLKSIAKIIDTGAPGTVPNVSMLGSPSYDITSHYNFDNGQRDNTYEHARITLKPGVPQPKGNILVIFNYYKHTGGDGYFTGMSYLSPISTSPEAYGSIPSYTAKDGTTYNLRDCLDWRPSRKNGTATRTFEYTGNPASDDTGFYIPQDLTNFTSNYSYYLARNDILVLSKDNSFQIVNGVPSTVPVLPSPPDGSLVISNLFNDPYTAFIPSEAPSGVLPNLSVQAVQHQRFTMQDISNLQNRLNNIEYYTSLSLLEQNTQALQVPDSNGLNRFKNGILVDDFSSFASIDTANPDFNASVDTVNKIMSASQTVTNYPLQSSVLYNALGNVSNTALSGLGFGVNSINYTTNQFSLPYTTTALVTQQLASNTISLNPFTTPIYQGSLAINPPMDNWVDNTKAPDLLLVDPNMTLYQQSSTLNVLQVGNWQTVPGSQYSTSSFLGYTIGHGINWSPFGYVGYGSTQVNTYQSQSQTTLTGYWSQLPSTYNNTNGFITNVSIQPYIRAQDLTVSGGSLKVNTPLTTSFDNTIVDPYISLPTVIELTNVSGTFATGDMIGYISGGNWYTVGTVLDVYNYPNTTNTRLYAFVSSQAITATTITTYYNAKFDGNGNWISGSATAYGTPNGGVVNGVTLNMTGGVVAADNGTTTSVSGGGTYATNVTQITLSPLASATNNFYTGSTISITSNNGSTSTTYTANVTNYVGSTKVATLDTPVNISLGYNSTAGLITSSYRIHGNKNWSNNTSYLLGISNGVAPQISTNEAGSFSGLFSIPASTFQNGQRIFRVDNRTVPTDPTSATTFATATFTASGLSTTSQNLDFSPSIDSAPNTFSATQYQYNQLISTSTVYSRWDPVAQTFIIDKQNYPNGVFLTSAKFFFQSKPTTSNSPVRLSIVGTLNGYPNGTELDHSIVTMTPDMINVSDNPHYLDSTTYTDFEFDAPVFIQPNKLYAFVLHSQSTEYNIYLAAQNATAIPSSVKNLPTDPTPTVITKIGAAPYVGSLFESQNSITWTADQTKALMFVLNQAQYDITQNPKIQFIVPTGLPNRKSVVNDVNRFVQANTISNLSGTYSTSNVLSDAYNITTTDLLPTTTNINYTYNATIAKTGSYAGETTVQPGRYGSPTLNNIYLNDGQGERVLVANSNSSFLLYASLSSNDPNVSPVISDDGLAVYNVQWNINNLPVTNSQITLVSGGSGYNNANSISVTVSSPDVAGGTIAVLGANAANGNIVSVYVQSGGSGYLAPPTITINDANTTPGSGATVQTVSEYSPKGGNAATRYITKKVVLAPGNDSGDLRVYLTAYRPSGSNIYVMYKILSSSDSSAFTDQSWQLMTPVNNGSFFSTTIGNTQEIEYAPGVNNIANNYIQYTSTSGTTYKSFIQFAIKVVLTTSDNTNAPYLTDIRALALPPGTGI